MSGISKKIVKSFKSKGLILKTDAVEGLISVLSKEEDVDGSLGLIIDEIKERIEKRDIKSNILDFNTITTVVADLSSSEEDYAQESLQLINAFNAPKIVYNEISKSYKVIPPTEYKLLSTVESRAKMYRDRLLFTQQRLLRSDFFSLNGIKKFNQFANMKSCELSTIESLLGSTGQKFLFGMLSQPEEGVWYLEDLGTIIKLNLTNAQSMPVFFTEGSHVIVQGELRNDTFIVDYIGLPPAEDRETSLQAIGTHDIFAAGIRSHQLAQLKELEIRDHNMLFVIISDIHLDNQLVLEKFQLLLDGFERSGAVPFYILFGSFFSKPISRVKGGREIIKSSFDALADIINMFPKQSQNAKFLVIPGPNDPGMPMVLPRRPIPAEFTQPLTDKVKNVTFASNPCRIRYFTQEIVLFREDLLKKMQKNLVLPLNLYRPEDPDITEQLVESIIDQAHLCPLPLSAKPVFWELDHSLRLFPLPHLLVLADHSDQYSYMYKSCNALNPGSFSSDFSFIVYQPSDQKVQFSRVN